MFILLILAISAMRQWNLRYANNLNYLLIIDLVLKLKKIEVHFTNNFIEKKKEKYCF